MKAPPVYFELRRRTLPIVEHYRGDLVKHDRRAIRRNPGTPFIHAAGNCGTFLLMLTPADKYPAPGEQVPYLFHKATREHILGEYSGMIDCYITNGRPVMHYFDGRGNLRKITHDRARQIVREYQARIRAEWKRAATTRGRSI